MPMGIQELSETNEIKQNGEWGVLLFPKLSFRIWKPFL